MEADREGKERERERAGGETVVVTNRRIWIDEGWRWELEGQRWIEEMEDTEEGLERSRKIGNG